MQQVLTNLTLLNQIYIYFDKVYISIYLYPNKKYYVKRKTTSITNYIYFTVQLKLHRF